INMALGDAVDMMRGAPDTQVSIFVMREGWESPRRFVLTRANIRVKSVKSRSLSGGIGLVHIRNFQSTTFNELTSALETLSQRAPRRQLKGLILDLRGNPGGLLDQAIKISDLFISEGSLVKTVGYGARVQEPKNATRQGTRENLPVVVLVDRSSASASEIVAGALRNHQRALVIGQQTFGKGSVQLIFDNADESALKLTIAQYLTPGDISIQSVGITPHIKTIPVMIGEEETDLFRSRTLRGGESRLPEHLIAADQNLAPNQRPLFELTFLEDLKLRERKRDAPNELIVDFEIDFARRVLVKTRRHHFRALSAAAEQVIGEEERTQEQKIAALLAERDVQWPGTPSQRGKGRAEISVTLDPPKGEVVAGETLSVRVDVKNQSQVPLAGLYALSESKSPVFDGHEFLFGEVPVGESRSWTTKVKVWPNAISRRDAVTLAFKGRGAIEIPSTSLSLAVKALPRPQLKLRYWLDDRKLGDGDGLLSPGEEVELVAVVRNEGPGVGLELVGTLSAEAKGEARGVFIKQGRIQPAEGTFAVGQEAEMRFRFQVKEGFEGRESTLFLNVIDAKLRDITRERVVLPLKQRPLLGRAGQLRATAGSVPLQSIPNATASVFEARAIAQVEGCLPSEGDQSTCQWYRVRSENGAFGWVPAREGIALSPMTTAQPPAGEQRFSISSPQIEFINREAIPAEAPEETINLQGIARATRPLKDLMIYVNNQKVFFIKGDGSSSLAFNTTVPLEAGENRVSIYARQDEEISGREVIIVHRPDDEKSAARSRRMRH
ncbi:MAG: S41 family peptidase, partial [Myxococcota bacterium]|nr:S41 family peptidase [Myxococcota bacterium]